MLFHDFYHYVKEKRIMPLLKTASENEDLAQIFHTHLCQMTANSMSNYKKKMFNQEPKLMQSLNQIIKFNSYNPLLQKQMGLRSNFQQITDMKLHEVCLDFENKFFPGKEGLKLHMLSYIALCPCLRENLDTDIDQIMFTEDEAYLAEAQERMYKSEASHTWAHLAELDKEYRTLIYGNTCHINDHIKATSAALKQIFDYQEKQRKEQIEYDTEIRNKIKSIVEDRVMVELKNVNFFGDNESEMAMEDPDDDEENQVKLQKTQYEMLKEEIETKKAEVEKKLTHFMVQKHED